LAKIILSVITLCGLVLFQINPCLAAPSVAINEIDWMGTAASGFDEWIELYNNTDQEIILDGWTLSEGDGTIIITLQNAIAAKSFYLIERTDDTTILDISADRLGSWGGGGLLNAGEKIILKDRNQNIIDEVDCSKGWFAGLASPEYRTMEKINPAGSSLADNWITNDGININGLDANGNPLSGTPKATNSATLALSPSPTPIPEPTLTPIPSSEPLPTPSISPAASPEPTPAPTPETTPTPEPTPTQQPPPSASPTPAPCSTGIFLTEFMPYPPKDQKEWVRLFNSGWQPISLTGWKITDDKNHSQAVPENTVINPGESLIVYLDKTFLNNDGDRVALLCPDGQVLQSVNYGKVKQGIPCVRQGSGSWLCEQTTASVLNQSSPSQTTLPPAASTSKPESSEPATLSAPTTPGVSPLKESALPNIIAKVTSSTKSQPSLTSVISTIKNTLLSSEKEDAANKTASEQNKKADLAAAATDPLSKTEQFKNYLWLGATIFSAALAGLGFLYFKKQHIKSKSDENNPIDF